MKLKDMSSDQLLTDIRKAFLFSTVVFALTVGAALIFGPVSYPYLPLTPASGTLVLLIVLQVGVCLSFASRFRELRRRMR